MEKIEQVEDISLVELLLPQRPSQGPPLPVFLNLRWPWKKRTPLNNGLVDNLGKVSGYAAPKVAVPDRVTTYRGGAVRPTTGAMATEGEGLYVAKQPELAKFFTEGKVSEVLIAKPKKPLIAEGPQYALMEDPGIYEPIKKTDTEWVKFQKQAAKNVGITDETWGKRLPALNKELTRLVGEAGYDAIEVPGREGWYILLDESLWKAPPK